VILTPRVESRQPPHEEKEKHPLSSLAAALAITPLLLQGAPARQRPQPPVAPTRADLAYAPASPEGSEGHLLDLYLPEGEGPFPLVLWSGGSAWIGE
jgi:hypothetical protein